MAPTAAQALAVIARRIESEVGITVSIGLAPNKFLAKLASELQKPAGFSVIGRAEAKAFLATLSVRKIHGVGAATARRMEAEGIRTIADLQAQSAQQLESPLRQVRPAARALRARRGRAQRHAVSAGEEHLRRDDVPARHGLGRGPVSRRRASLCDEWPAQLERKRLAGGTVVLKMKTSDFRILTRNRRLAHPTQRATCCWSRPPR